MCAAMGTAPHASQQPSMPDPKRVVSRSLAMLAELGYTKRHAVEEIISAATVARRRMHLIGMWNTAWFDAIIDCAAAQGTAPGPSRSEHPRSEYGDGSSSRAGSPAGHQETR